MPLRHIALAFLALLLLPASALAQTPGNCSLGDASTELSLSDVRARLYNTGSLFWKGADPEYEVPKDGDVVAIFAAGIWAGGTVGGEVRTAAATFAQGTGNTYEYWPGPLDDGATLPDADDCSDFDRIYRISAPELAAYEAGNPPTSALVEWPVGLGAPAVDAAGAPVVPTSREQTVDLDAGERPVVYGTETAFWVMNDVGNDHSSEGSQPLGIEVRVAAFSINDPAVSVLDQATLYRYQVINRSANTIDDFRLGLWIDQDLGDFADDYVGSDPDRGMFYAYNSDNDDALGAGGYGIAPPAIGVDFLSGAFGAVYYTNTSDASGNPNSAADYYNYLSSRQLSGSPRTRPDGSVVTWDFDGDPVTNSYWTEVDADPAAGLQPTMPGDRRGVISALPVTLAPGASTTVDFAIVFARGASNLASITELRAASDLVQARYDDGSLFESTSGDLGLPPVVAPALLSPADGTMFTPPEALVLDWETLASADAYRIDFSSTPDFQGVRSQTATAPPLQVDFTELPMGSFEPIYWRVAAVNAAGSGPSSPARSFTYAFEYQAGVQLLSNDQPAFLEIVGPGGADPCGGAAESTFGCDEAGGNAVFGGNRGETADANGTGQYGLFSAGPFDLALTRAAPREVEIRFTAAGSIATHLFGDTPNSETIRVPFELWDVGVVTLGADGVPAVNDPSDDVQLVPVLFSDGGGACDFEFGEIPAIVTGTNPSGLAQTDRVYGYYAATSYADFDAVAAPLVDAATDGCYDDADDTIGAQIDTENRVLERITIADVAGSGSVADLQGAVIRLYTTNPQIVADEAAPTASVLALSVAPNPSRSGARVAFTLPTAGTVRVRVVDTLGRTVAVLADGERAAGPHAATLPRGLAAGIYVVTVEAGDARATQRLTVVR